MTITEMIRSIGEKVFLPFVALCMVGVFSSVSFAEEATTNKPAPKLRQRKPLIVRRRERSSAPGKATGKGIERGANAH